MQAERKPKALRSAPARSRVTNRSSVVNADGRSVWARRLRDLIEAHEADQGDSLTEAQRALIRRASTLQVELERLEAGFASMGEIDPKALDAYGRASNTLRRLLTSLGIKRDIDGAVPSWSDAFSHAILGDPVMRAVCIGSEPKPVVSQDAQGDVQFEGARMQEEVANDR